MGYASAVSTLEIEFRNGRTYRFFAVPPGIYDGLRTAESKGGYFNHFIRGRFPFVSVRT